MKFVVLTTAALMAASSASAMDLGNTGLTFGGEVVAEHTVDAGDTTVVFTPALGYTLGGVALTASTDLSIYNNDFVIGDTLEVLPVIDFTAEYALRENAVAYFETSYDLEAKARGEMTLGLSFSF